MSTRLAGHELFNEGAPHDAKGRRLSLGLNYTTKGVGRGKCTCGALSPELDSGNKRKQWHKEHKQKIREEMND